MDDEKNVVEKQTKMIDGKQFDEFKSVGWDPKEVGDTISGVFIGVQDDVGKYKSKVYSLDNGMDIIDFFGKTVLDRKMKAVTPGENIAVEFLGEKTTEDGKTKYKDYRLYKLSKN